MWHPHPTPPPVKCGPMGKFRLYYTISSKSWHVAYQIVGIFDGEFKYGTYFVENQNFEKNLDQKFKNSKFWKLNIFSNYGMWHIKLQGFFMWNSNMEPILWKIKILKTNWTKNCRAYWVAQDYWDFPLDGPHGTPGAPVLQVPLRGAWREGPLRSGKVHPTGRLGTRARMRWSW